VTRALHAWCRGVTRGCSRVGVGWQGFRAVERAAVSCPCLVWATATMGPGNSSLTRFIRAMRDPWAAMSSRSARCCGGARLRDAPESIDVDQLVAPCAPSGWNIHIANCGGFIPPMAGQAARSGPVAYRGLPATPPAGRRHVAGGLSRRTQVIAGEAAANVSSSPWVTVRAPPWSAGPHPSARPASRGAGNNRVTSRKRRVRGPRCRGLILG
jgi:hypothetical protein